MVTALLGLLLLPATDVEPPSPAPKGTPPQVITAKIEGERLTATRMVTSYRTEFRTEKAIVGAREVTRTVRVVVPVTTMVQLAWNLKRATAQQADGKKIEMAELKKMLAKPAAVLVSGDGKPVDKGYLSLFKKETIVIVAPATAPGDVPVPRPGPGFVLPKDA